MTTPLHHFTSMHRTTVYTNHFFLPKNSCTPASRQKHVLRTCVNCGTSPAVVRSRIDTAPGFRTDAYSRIQVRGGGPESSHVILYLHMAGMCTFTVFGSIIFHTPSILVGLPACLANYTELWRDAQRYIR